MLVEYKCLLWNYLGAFKIHILPVLKFCVMAKCEELIIIIIAIIIIHYLISGKNLYF